MNMERGTGRTTKQMKQAPQGALFVWCNGVTSYARTLAREIGRHDLVIASPYDLESDRLRGQEFQAVIIDHAARLTPQQSEIVKRIFRP